MSSKREGERESVHTHTPDDDETDYLPHLMAEIHELNANIRELAFQISRFKKWVADMDYRIRWVQKKLDGGRPLSRPPDTPDPKKHGDPPSSACAHA